MHSAKVTLALHHGADYISYKYCAVLKSKHVQFNFCNKILFKCFCFYYLFSRGYTQSDTIRSNVKSIEGSSRNSTFYNIFIGSSSTNFSLQLCMDTFDRPWDGSFSSVRRFIRGLSRQQLVMVFFL